MKIDSSLNIPGTKGSGKSSTPKQPKQTEQPKAPSQPKTNVDQGVTYKDPRTQQPTPSTTPIEDLGQPDLEINASPSKKGGSGGTIDIPALDDISETLDELEDSVEDLNDTVGDLGDSLGGITDSLDGLENTVGGLGDSLGGINDSLDGLQDSLGGISDGMAGLPGLFEGILEEFNNTLSELKDSLNNLPDSSLGELKDMIQELLNDREPADSPSLNFEFNFNFENNQEYSSRYNSTEYNLYGTPRPYFSQELFDLQFDQYLFGNLYGNQPLLGTAFNYEAPFYEVPFLGTMKFLF